MKINALLATLAFYASNRNSWHSFSPLDAATVKAVKRLEKLGYLRTNEFHQAKFTGKVFE